MLDSQQLKKRPPRPRSEPRFVEAVRVRHARGSLNWILWTFWGIILLKCVLAHWAIVHWQMPVSPFWIWFPTLIAGAAGTALFLVRDRTDYRM